MITINKLEYVAQSLSRGTNKVYETYVVNAIYQKVNNPGLEIETQKKILLPDGSNKRIDLYLPQLKIAIEVDESYHESDNQKKADLARENAINSSLTTESIISSIRFLRVPVFKKTLEELNSVIDVVVNIVNYEINKRGGITWLFGDEVIDKIRKRGYLETDDCFSTNYEIINLLYGKTLKNWQRASYKNVWFPVISVYDPKHRRNTSRKGWINYFSPSKDIIFEKSESEDIQLRKEKEALCDHDVHKERIVFVKEKNAYGFFVKRFAGVFIADGWDQAEQAERWKKIKTRLDIPLIK